MQSQAAAYYDQAARREEVRRVALLRADRHNDAEVALRASCVYQAVSNDYQRACDALMRGDLDANRYYSAEAKNALNAAGLR